MTALALIIVVGAVASASPSLRTFFGEQHLTATGPTGATGEDDPSDSPEAPEQDNQSTDAQDAQAPDFSACDGLTGLDNAICRHEALLVVHPDNQGLLNALARLEANQAKQDSSSHGSQDSTTPPGKSGDTQGKSGDTHGNSGQTQGNSGQDSSTDSTDTSSTDGSSDSTGPGNSNGHGNSSGQGNSSH